MKVVMLQDVGGVGQRGKVVEVSDGYALNLLIPNGKAVQATPQKEAEVKKHLAAEHDAREKEASVLRAGILALENAEIVLTAKATPKGGLFKAVTVADIARAVHEQKKVEIAASVIQLAKPIKEIGEHAIALKNEKAASTMRLIIRAA
jgi:large subunit ribosomal protein L9